MAHHRHASRRIPFRERKYIPDQFFALPERAPGHGSLPLMDPRKGLRYDPTHVRNAAARLNQMRLHGSVTPDEYKRAATAIMRGARATGVDIRRLSLKAVVSHETRMAAFRRNSRGRFTR